MAIRRVQPPSAFVAVVRAVDERVVTAGAWLPVPAAGRVVTRRLMARAGARSLGRSAGRAVIGAVHPGEAPTHARAALLCMPILMRERDRDRDEEGDAKQAHGPYQTT